jgi:hypothetical protein
VLTNITPVLSQKDGITGNKNNNKILKLWLTELLNA